MLTIAEWLELVDASYCWCCRRRFSHERRREIHHIERRSHCRAELKDLPCNLFVACSECHEGPLAAGQEGMPSKHHARQLAMKLMHDPVHFNRALWLSIKPHPVSYVTAEDVTLEFERLYDRPVDMRLRQGRGQKDPECRCCVTSGHCRCVAPLCRRCDRCRLHCECGERHG